MTSALFLGHGNPMNALGENSYTAGWRRIAAAIPKPKSILCVSAHWYIPDTCVTSADHPRTIHDFAGFPRQLHEVDYPAPGSAVLGAEVIRLLQPEQVRPDADWGLDHGTWSVLVHLYPEADIPVVQLSINRSKPARWHFDIARRLRPLREQGVLIVGSGNLVHNLHAYAWGKKAVEPYDWAVRFETTARALIASAEFQPLIDLQGLGRDAALAAPTPEHFLPLLYVLAQYADGEPIGFPVDGFDGGSVSMLAVRIG